MRSNKSYTKRKTKDFQSAKKAAILIASIVLFAILGTVWLGSSVSYKNRQKALPSLHRSGSLADIPDKPKKTFFLKLYDYIAKEQMELHQSLDKI